MNNTDGNILTDMDEALEREIIGDGLYLSSGYYIDTDHIDAIQRRF